MAEGGQGGLSGKVYEVVQVDLGQVVVDDPVHQGEADKGHGEEDPAVLVNIRGGHAQDVVQVGRGGQAQRAPADARPRAQYGPEQKRFLDIFNQRIERYRE